MIAGVIGKVIDDKGISIPYTTVMITDIDGKSLSPAIGVVADSNGNYSIGVSKDNKKLGTHLTAKSMGYKDKIIPIKFTGVNNKSDIIMTESTSKLPEVIIIASKSKFDCEKKGGVWDEVTKSCKLPVKEEQLSWFDENKWLILGGGVFLGAIVATILIVSKNKIN